ncbi:MAG: rhodanese-like domain-containing protein [Chromatiales bacterium]|nr:rhodanese-like domain-containing protein [Chromatiales bacterium]
MKMFRLLALVLAALFASTTFAATSPENVDGATTVDTAAVKKLFDKGVAIVDVRKDSDWQAGRISDAIHIELKKAFNEGSLGAEVKKGDEVVFYCNGHGCLRSSKATKKAVGWGYTKVYYYRDGFPAWKAAGYPAE